MFAVPRYFYPRPPRGGRPTFTIQCSQIWEFLSTPSARRATVTFCYFIFAFCISIHALREEGDFTNDFLSQDSIEISIHALREEGDIYDVWEKITPIIFLSTPSARRATVGASSSAKAAKFLSTPSARRATEVCGADRRVCEISIHALREEGDLTIGSEAWLKVVFLSTPSARRATSPGGSRLRAA